MLSHYSDEVNLDMDEPNRKAIRPYENQDFGIMVVKELKALPILDNVINLSDHPLTESQKEILKGLKFCPSPGEPQMGDLRKELDRYH